MANDVRMICWETPDRLVLGIRLANLAGETYPATEELVQIDTGFSGEILVPYALFEMLALSRWRLPEVIQATTVTGQTLHLYEAYADVLIPQLNTQYRVTVQTFEGNTRFLIGRGFLRRLRVLLDGPNARTCVLEDRIE